MKADICIRNAEKHRASMEAAISPLNEKLKKLFDDYNASVFYQPGDGWCVLFKDDHNVPVGDVDFDALFSMSKNDALEYLMKSSI